MKIKLSLAMVISLPVYAFAANTTVENDISATEILSSVHDRNPQFEVITPGNDAANQTAINKIYSAQYKNEFGDERYALMFMPGDYNLDVKVGYSTQVLGLGQSPDDTHIIGAVRTQDAVPHGDPSAGPGALDNFWRSVENVAITPTLGSVEYSDVPKDQLVWAVSQAAPMRRVHIVDGSLRFFDKGWASGGFLANSYIDKDVITGSQQQWFAMKNKYDGSWGAGNWNMVFVANEGQQPQASTADNPSPADNHWDNWPYTMVNQTAQKTRTKPYLAVKNDKVGAIIPNLLAANSTAPDWLNSLNVGQFVEIGQQNFITPSDNDAENIQKALDTVTSTDGWHIVVLTPGVYKLDKALKITKDKTLVLGLGMPILKAKATNALIDTSSAKDTIMAGFVIAGSATSKDQTLVTIGDGESTNSTENPNMLFDIFCRVGGATDVEKAKTCMQINDSDVIGSNLWLWRADHGSNVGWDKNTVDHGLIVNGDNVSMYGLFVEHFQKTQTIWNGKNGSVDFYQSELPYDPPSQDDWSFGTQKGYSSLLISEDASGFKGRGLGVYAAFINTHKYAYLDNAILDEAKGTDLKHMITVYLNGNADAWSGINSIVNGIGAQVQGIGGESPNRHSAINTNIPNK